ncbi:MAG: hypothetical protein R3F60_17200 [bacterium]
MRGAGGTEGGAGRFILGLIMFVGGGYLFLDNIRVHSGFHWGMALFDVGGMGVTSGMTLIPFVLGVGMIFYNARNPIGWLLAIGSVVAMGFGVLANAHFELRRMSLFNLLTILVLGVGGAGLLLSGLRARPALSGPRRRGELGDDR